MSLPTELGRLKPVCYKHPAPTEPKIALLFGGFIFDEIENVFVLESNIEFPQQRQIFVFERILLMMLLLIADVLNDLIQLRVAIREGAEAFLPMKLASDP